MSENDSPRKLLTPLSDALIQLGVSRRQFYRLVDRGDIRRIKLGSRVYVPQEDLDAYYQAALASAGGA